MHSESKRSRDTCQRLLDAACAVFAEKGYHEATIAEICEKAGANIAAVNYHFGGKETLYVRAWKLAFERSLAAHPPDGGVPPEAPPETAPSAVKTAPSPARAAEEGDQAVPWTPIRKRIAQHMVASKQTSPHVHIFAEIDMHRAVAHRAELKGKGVSLTYLPYVMFAAAKALKEFPIVNAAVSGESTILKKDIHIAVAVDTEKGLLVPVVRHADRKSLVEMSRAVDELGARAKEGKILPDELSGGTFSVSNPGAKGNLFGTPIINQPQVGILRMGQVVKRPVVVSVDGEDGIAIRPMMFLCMAYDHRVIDGVAGNGFLFRVREILEAGDFG